MMIRSGKIFVLAGLAMLLLCAALSGADDSGRESLFLFGAGARSLGMGGAFSAVADNASAVYYNPAGLASLEYREITFLGATLSENTKYLFAGGAYPVLGFGTFGFGAINLGTDEIVFRDRLGRLGEFDYSDGQYWFSYGLRINRFVSIGSNLKYLNRSLGDLNTSTGSFDLGLLFSYKNVVFAGLNAQDIFSGTMKLGSEGEDLPYNFKGGLALKISSGNIDIIAAGDVDKTEDVATKIHVGSEIGINQTFFLRGGYDRTDITFGAGIRYGFVGLDYAFKGNSDLDASHRIGLSFFFGPTISAQREDRIEKQRREEEQRAEDARKRRISVLADKAQLFYQEQTWDSAAVYYNQVLAYDSTNVEAITRLREITDKLESAAREEIDTRAGEMAYNRLLNSRLNAADSLYNLAEYENSRSEYQKVLQIDKDNQHALERLENIREHFNQRFNRYVAEGDSLFDAGQYADAVVAYNEGLEIRPGASGLNQKIGLAKERLLIAQKLSSAVELLNAGDTAAARAAFSEVLELDPDDEVALGYLKRMEVESPAEPVSIEQLKQDQEYWQIYLEGLKFLSEGKYEQAIERWETVLEKYPGSRDTRENLRQARIRLEQEKEE